MVAQWTTSARIGHLEFLLEVVGLDWVLAPAALEAAKQKHRVWLALSVHLRPLMPWTAGSLLSR